MYIIVGFRVDSERSIYYRKCKDIDELKLALEQAFTSRKADFVSIRRVKRNNKII